MRLSAAITTLPESAARELDARKHSRSSMFLAAVLRAGTEQAAVRVRNMSSNGAMVDTPLRPSPGSEVQLVRGSLLAKGTVVWRTESRCGLRFDSELSVKNWLAVPAASEQQRVDRIVALAKAGEMLPRLLNDDGLYAIYALRSKEQLVDDLGAVVRLMQDLENDLACSEETLGRHGEKLQNLDIAMQMVRAIAHELTAPKFGEPAKIASLENLRVACGKPLDKP